MSGERGQATNSLPTMQHRAKKCLPMADILSLPICVSRFAVNMGVSRETQPGKRWATGQSL